MNDVKEGAEDGKEETAGETAGEEFGFAAGAVTVRVRNLYPGGFSVYSERPY